MLTPTGCNHKIQAPIPVAPISIQQKASHMVTFLDNEGEPEGLCTATAIGPHAIMTASHCNEGPKQDSLIRLDLSRKVFHILAATTDSRDHVIYLVDATFTNVIEYKARKAVVGEHVFIYGDGGAEYPARLLSGTAIEFPDHSDVDANDGIVCFSIQVIGGDSGSAIYGDDGSILALVTYGNVLKKDSVSFALDFSERQIAIAQHFDPKDETTWP